ncbi:accessory gene regulator B [Paenibacillus tianmuensis]|uniref:Accessory gene regulator B n=1 Tax=Paenibacillus tianmuensis TaxID=624147 RepID=A0A1G4TX84_9BACL|nr:accessory gene regulator B family protein [Paenibacillus tianmuensis]SCW85189.1 accessory gene regulator B [Paenibacillus tianmuensis]
MNPIDSMASYLAKVIRKHNEHAGSEIALKYALSLTINTSLATIVSLLISVITNRFNEAIIGICIFLLIRYVSGGIHLSSSLACCITSILIFVTIANVPTEYTQLSVYLNIISFIILLFTAPNNIKDVSRIPQKFYPLLKIVTLVIISSNFFIKSTVFTAAFIIQAVLTMKYTYKIVSYFERRVMH